MSPNALRAVLRSFALRPSQTKRGELLARVLLVAVAVAVAVGG